MERREQLSRSASSFDASQDKDAYILILQRNMEQLETQAQAELEELHVELLKMRTTCHKLEVGLNESEAKR